MTDRTHKCKGECHSLWNRRIIDNFVQSKVKDECDLNKDDDIEGGVIYIDLKYILGMEETEHNL
jgi:hypothetical protein